MRKLVTVLLTVAALAGVASWWRNHRRVGTDFVNRRLNPWLVERGIVGLSRGELALIEHVGRKSRTVRQTPIHPMPIEGGYRIIVPVGESSEWVRNVLAAGGCRMLMGERTVTLDAPVLERPSEVPGLALPARVLFGWLGFRYLRLRTRGETAQDERVAVGEPAQAQPMAA